MSDEAGLARYMNSKSFTIARERTLTTLSHCLFAVAPLLLIGMLFVIVTWGLYIFTDLDLTVMFLTTAITSSLALYHGYKVKQLPDWLMVWICDMEDAIREINLFNLDVQLELLKAQIENTNVSDSELTEKQMNVEYLLLLKERIKNESRRARPS